MQRHNTSSGMARESSGDDGVSLEEVDLDAGWALDGLPLAARLAAASELLISSAAVGVLPSPCQSTHYDSIPSPVYSMPVYHRTWMSRYTACLPSYA